MNPCKADNSFYYKLIASRVAVLFILAIWLPRKGISQPLPANLVEDSVAPYQLPDPLLRKNGKKITSVKEWNSVQRPYIYGLFEKYVYGRFPRTPVFLTFILNSVDSNALGGKAICKQVTIYFSKYDISTNMELLLYLPKEPKTPVPVFLGLNFSGNHTVNSDTGIIITKNWVYKGRGVVNNRATDSTRGSAASQWDIAQVIERGYGLATVYYGDLEPDNREGWKTGIRTKLASALQIKPTEWGALGAWAWGLSRVMDYLQTDKAVNAKQVVLMGHSRLGKAALWAGVSDPRFAIVISNESGEGGAALSKRNYGETVAILNKNFPYWFVPAYQKYSDNTRLLPVDQHMLLSLVAPRPLYVSSAVEDRWSDPKGEFLSTVEAGKVYALFKKPGLGTVEMPTLDEAVGDFPRYHIRSGKHDVTPFDWKQYLDFADRHFKL